MGREGDDTSAWLVDISSEPCLVDKYAALSYCWGNGSESHKLIEANLENLFVPH